MHTVVVFMGTRPEGIKLAPVIRALDTDPNLDVKVVNTGQHREMLAQVVDLFGVRVDLDLQVMSPGQSLAELTARLISGVDEVLDSTAADLALVQGDTTTVLAASLACFYRHVPLGHVEAGLRTQNLRSPFPEEANRVVASVLAEHHFAPTTGARDNLLAEGVDESRVHVTGNTVIDALLLEVTRQESDQVRRDIQRSLGGHLDPDWASSPFVLITGHRRESFGSGFGRICDAIGRLAERFADHRFIYPVHLNPNVQEPVRRILGDLPNVDLIPPQPYAEFVALLQGCRLVLTDSGGVQEEAPSLGKPVLVMRDTTERPEGIEAGVVELVGTEVDRIVDCTTRLLTHEDDYERMSRAANPYGDGRASQRIAAIVRQALSQAA